MDTSRGISNGRSTRAHDAGAAATNLGAVTDALAVVLMLLPPIAALLWGFDETSGGYRFAMGYGASLMLGWTGLLALFAAAYRYPRLIARPAAS